MASLQSRNTAVEWSCRLLVTVMGHAYSFWYLSRSRSLQVPDKAVVKFS